MRHAWIAVAAALALLGAQGVEAQAPSDKPEQGQPNKAPAKKKKPAEQAGGPQAAPPGEASSTEEAAEPEEAGEPTETGQAAEVEPGGAMTETSVTDTTTELNEPAEAGAQAYEPAARPLTSTHAAQEKDTDIIPLRVELHGYYRARWNWINNVPRPDPDGAGPTIPGTNDLSFGYQRLRLEPVISYGPKKDSPIASLHVQIDGLDNVVFGDNAALTSPPLFAENPSLTDIHGFDLRDSLYLKRAWLEFLVPVGQIRVGRMPSDWGLGLLSHGGQGLSEWGDYFTQSTYDRILFATRPLTIYNAIAHDDSSETPMIFAFAYDRLVESTLPDGATFESGPIASSYAERSKFPFQWEGDKSDQVNEIVFALVWDQDDFGTRATDHLTAGYYFVNRWQDSTDSHIFIDDLMWKVQHGLGKGLPSFFTEGEFLNIKGRTDTALNGLVTKANLFAVVGRAGVTDPGKWTGMLEMGFDSGDKTLVSNKKLTVRAFHPNYKVGLLMYQVAELAVSQKALPAALQGLGANGSAWDTKYIWPQVRYTLMPGIEVHGAFLVGWAHKLNQVFGSSAGADCGFGKDCFLGWELDGALRIRWGDNDLMWFDLEAGLMKPGNALTRGGSTPNGNGISGDWGDALWTFQMRTAMQF